eukprot:GEMP01126027.1.p1 GENE.GEMP01126027.1~~GEMP01126027.1.p1  ORF type:complete len:126 (+),score=22.85 GEMP01126027.1:101-478(+)
MMLGFVLLFPAIYAIMGEIQACDHCGLDDNPDLRRFLKGEDEVGRYVNLTRRVSTWQVTLIGLDGRAGGGRGTTARRLTITTCGATLPQTKKLSLENRSLAQLHELVQNLGFPMKDIDSEKREEL